MYGDNKEYGYCMAIDTIIITSSRPLREMVITSLAFRIELLLSILVFV